MARPSVEAEMCSVLRSFYSCALILGGLGALGTTVALAQPQAAGKKNLTVERLYSSPSLGGHLTTGIEWSPDSKRISYLERKGNSNGEGISTELWTMDASTGERRVLVNAETMKSVMQPPKTSAIQSTGLGRVRAENYIWSPRGNALLFIGGTSLIRLDLGTMQSKPLVTGEQGIEDAKFSPDGKWISFIRNSNLWVVSAEGGEPTALTTGGSQEILKGKLDWVYPEELDARTAYWWSPDSAKIAYYQMDERPVTRYPITDMSSPVGAMEFTRYPQAGEANPIVRVGVVPVGGGETVWMDTGADTNVYVPRVNWLHDSARLAVQRLNRSQNRLDLLFCAAATGSCDTTLTETDKYWINVSDDLYFFADGNRFLWSSERSGYRHYYLYDLSGHELEQVTSGDWAITGEGGFGPGTDTHPAVDEEHGFIYFISNRANSDETQIYRISLADKSITQITREHGTHNAAFAPDASAFVDTFSTSANPPLQQLDHASGSPVAVLDDGKIPELNDFRLSPVEFLKVPAEDGTPLPAEMIKPPDFHPEKKYPVLINVYGGPHAQEVRNAWGGINHLWHEMMAEKGYIIFTLDNRGSFNYGHAYETPIFHQFGKVELQDQLAGVKYLKSLPYVDGSRIGIWGWSYGGYMTLFSMFNAPDVFKVGVSVAPVSDWRLYDTIYTERYMGRPQDNPDGYKNSSPINQAKNLKGQLMLAHGTGDDNVHFANTSEVLNELIENGKYPADLMIFPGRGHPIGDRAARIQLFTRITQFLLNNL
jgi:dipeptidyl-peptidase 4